MSGAWVPRPARYPDEPACWSWPVPPSRSREEEIARQLAESMRGRPDDRVTRDVIEAVLDHQGGPCMDEFQRGRCAICGGPRAEVDDHCHETGQRRGWLDRTCNQREGTSSHVLFVRYRLWHPAAILDINAMYTGRGWRNGWPGGHRASPARPPTPWPAWDDAWLQPDYEPPVPDDEMWDDHNPGLIARQRQKKADPQ